MEKGLNIVAILKDKPVGLKFYSPTFGCVTFNGVHKDKVYFFSKDTNAHSVKQNGKMFDDGECIIFPSKEMRDWEKLSWKKGDVLQNNDHNIQVIFDRFTSDTYEMIRCKYWLKVDNGNEKFIIETNEFTKNFFKVSEELSQCYINEIENRLGGKLNLETLEIEKQPNFKDGDIVALVVRKCTHIAIFQSRQEKYIGFHAVLCQNDELLLEEPFREDYGDIELRPATDSEKQQLFEALAKEGKTWDAEKKMLVDLPKKCEFKPFDKVLARDSASDKWRANLFGYISEDGYYCCVFASWAYCIPYAGNEHLLGTTKDVEG